ncbi:MAG: GNAT family N-acetyltransferase [Acidobacteriota bacterium]|nr:GNAT family N-acetyltransferase [Acidobacteriota bacterium]MDH3528313.1 GNAT family N-acetyltransferase [Acidobacteriota bacterium]
MKKAFQWGEILPSLKGTRLKLESLKTDDAPQILAIFGDPEVMRYWGMPPLENTNDARRFIKETHEEFARRDLFGWGIRWNETGKIVGTSTLLNLDRPNRRGEIGFAVAQASWGKGIATEAVETLIGFAFNTLDLHRLEADVDPKNTASLRVLEKQGFVREGLLRERWYQMGEVQDTVFLGLLKREWTGGSV